MILQSADFQCEWCLDRTSTLHVHHLWYEAGREPWEYPDQALITLCKACHEEETRELPRAISRLILALKMRGGCAQVFDDLAMNLKNAGPEYGPLMAVKWVVDDFSEKGGT